MVSRCLDPAFLVRPAWTKSCRGRSEVKTEEGGHVGVGLWRRSVRHLSLPSVHSLKDSRWRRFSEELSELDPVYEAAISGLPTLTASMDVDGEEDEEGLAGLEVEEDAPVELDTDMVNGDDPITRMEARLAQFAKVSISHHTQVSSYMSDK